MLEQLDDYDWREAFGYVGEADTCAIGPFAPLVAEGASCDASPFARADVAEVLHARIGENDGPEWLMIGRLHDGRFFYLECGCDYTGWDCQAGGRGWVAHSLWHLYAFGVTEQARQVFGLNQETLHALAEATE